MLLPRESVLARHGFLLGCLGQCHTRLLQGCLLNPFLQVVQWRAQQEEAAELEAAVAARRKEMEDEKERLQKEQERLRRAEESQKVWESFVF